MQYSPKLKKAMQEIEAILKSNDIAGFVVLHTPGHSEILNHLQTTYSCAEITPEGIRLRLKEKEIGREKALKLAEGTYNMVTHLADMIAFNANMYLDCQERLKVKWNGFEEGGELSSHSQQNN